MFQVFFNEKYLDLCEIILISSDGPCLVQIPGIIHKGLNSGSYFVDVAIYLN